MSCKGHLLLKQQPFMPFGIRTLDLNQPVEPVIEVPGYERVLLVLKVGSRVAGIAVLAAPNGEVTEQTLRAYVADDPDLSDRIDRLKMREKLMPVQDDAGKSAPSWSVVVCTRDRAEDLRRCLESLVKAADSQGEIVIVDNNPPDDSTKRVARQFPVKYCVEPRQGLNWARTCGAKAASGEVLIYTDDDVVVDVDWIWRMAAAFESPRVAAVTGLTFPLELESEAQALFEFYGGHGRGFERRVFDESIIPASAAGLVGSGANMAIRREIVLSRKLFEQELDVGTRTLSGGDTYAFYQLLDLGYQVVYEPDAVVWHRHRRDDQSLKKMLYGYSVGGYALLMRCLAEHGDPESIMVGLQWFKHHHLKQLWRALRAKPDALPMELVLTEWRGAFMGPWAYWLNRWATRKKQGGASP